MLKTLQNIKNIAFLCVLMPLSYAFSMDVELPEEVMQSVAAINAIKIPSYQELQQDETLFLKTESLLAKASVLGTKKRIKDALSEEESKIEHLSPKAKIKIKISIMLTIQSIGMISAYSAARDAAAYSAAGARAEDVAEGSAANKAAYLTAYSAARDAAYDDAYSAASDVAFFDPAKDVSDAAFAAVSNPVSNAAKKIQWSNLDQKERNASEQYVFLVSLQAVQNFIISNNSCFKNIITTTVDAHLENPPKEGWDTFKIKRKGINEFFSRIENKEEKDISLYFAPYIPLWNEIYCTNKKTAILLLGIQKSRMTHEKRSILNKDIMQIIAKKAKKSDD